MSSRNPELRAQRWGDRTAMTLQHDWVGWVQQRMPDEVILVDADTNVVRIVTEAQDDGPLNLTIPDMAALDGVHEGRYVLCAQRTLWFGNLPMRLPDSAAWDSTLYWHLPATEIAREHVSRQLALLADWLLARAPEGSFAALVPDLLTAPHLTATVVNRTDLPAANRMMLVQAAEILSFFMPALTDGDMITVEEGAARLAGLGEGTFPAGAAFLLGMVAGLRVWEPFLSEGSGLHADGVTHRLTRGHGQQSSFLAMALLRAADEHAWGARWHALHATLLAPPRYGNAQHNYLRTLITAWLEQDSQNTSAGIAGLLLPFLWHQHHIRAL